MSEQRMWRVIMPAMRRVLFGGARQPNTRRIGEINTLTMDNYCYGMNEDYNWFRQGELIFK